MDLREYLFKKRMNVKEFSDLMECSRAYMSLVVHGKAPSKRLAKQIEAFTGGEVSYEEIMKEKIMKQEIMREKRCSRCGCTCNRFFLY